MFNGKSLQFYNVWGRGNNKDYTDLANQELNNDYELQHPAGSTHPNYNMVTYVQIATDQNNYVMFVEIPYKLMEDFSYGVATSTSSYHFELRDGSAWYTPDGVVRQNYKPADGIAVNEFIDANMHMSDYTSNSGYCSDNEHHYYLTAKQELNKLSTDQRTAFQTAPSFEEARARYEAWAVANNDSAPYDGNDSVVTPINSGLFKFFNDSSSKIALVIFVSVLLTITSIGMMLFVRKRKHI